MARIAKFRYGTTDVDIDFDGSVWHTESWVPKASVAGEDVEETPTVLIVTASDDTMAEQIQLLDDLMLRVERYRENPAYETPVWLHAKRNLETNERRAIVKRLSYTPLNSEFDCEAMQYQSEYQINIVRGGYWESPSYRQHPPLAAVAGASVEWDYTAAGGEPAHDIVGDVPARLAYLIASNATVGIDKLYAGIRSADVRQITNFEGIWECEDGTNTARGADDAASEVNLASPGAGAGVLVVGTPTGNDTWEEYLAIRLDDVYGASADYDAAFGTFLWLLRCKATAVANTFQVQLRWGYDGMADADYVRGPIVELTDIDWDYLEMGVQKVPPRNYQVITNSDMSLTHDASMEVQIWAQRTLGAGTIKLDCLCPIAVDEGYLVIKDAIVAASGFTVYGEGPTGQKATYSYTAGGVLIKYGRLNSQEFGYPPGDGRIDFVYTRTGGSVLTDTIRIFGSGDGLIRANYYERWRTLRGVE